jgi:hypothetical protein
LRGPARCEVQRVAGHRSNVATFSALLAIAATLRRPARCWPSQQRCDVQRIAGHRSNVTTSSALLAIAATLRHLARCCNSAARTLQAVVRCRPTSQQRYELQRSRPSLQRCEEASLPAIAAAAAELYTFDFRRTSVGFSSYFCRTSVQLPSDIRWIFVRLSSDVRPIFVGRPSNFRPSNFHPTSDLGYCLRQC